MTEATRDAVDIAIVGGGVSGLYAAYRLVDIDPSRSTIMSGLLRPKGRRPDIRLFEATDRVGGRLHSYRFTQCPDLVAELGGQGFSRLQRNVSGLVDRFNLRTQPCLAYAGARLQYFRRHRFHASEYADRGNFPPEAEGGGFTRPFKIPYFVQASEMQPPLRMLLAAVFALIPELEVAVADIGQQLKKLGELKTGPAVEKVLADIATFMERLRDYCDGDVCKGAHGNNLWDMGFWNWLSRRLTHEAYDLLLHSSFANSRFRNFNTYDQLSDLFSTFFSFSLNTPFWELAEGYDRLPHALHDSFMARGGKVHLEHQLIDIRIETRSGEQLIALTFRSARDRQEIVVHARHAILALPRGALAHLNDDCALRSSPQFDKDIDAVAAVPASKLFLLYERPWWEDVVQPNPASGYSTTDLPIRACYYIGHGRSGKALILASLNDGVDSEFWDGFVDSRARSGLSLKGAESHVRLAPPIPADMQREAHEQLVRIHFDSGADGGVPPVLSSYFHSWSGPPYFGGWHAWRPHVRSWELIPRIRHPVRHANIYICNEAFSDLHGWVEGALNSTERMLEDHFDLPRPDWVETTYDLGP